MDQLPELHSAFQEFGNTNQGVAHAPGNDKAHWDCVRDMVGQGGGGGKRGTGVEGASYLQNPTQQLAIFPAPELVALHHTPSADSMQLPVTKRGRKNDIELEVEILI